MIWLVTKLNTEMIAPAAFEHSNSTTKEGGIQGHTVTH